MTAADGGTGDASFNIDSTRDDGTGEWTVIWKRSFADAKYAVVPGKTYTVANVSTGTITADSVKIYVRNDAGTFFNAEDVSVIAIGDQ